MPTTRATALTPGKGYNLGVNSKAKGEVSEAFILAALTERGYPVSLPFGNNQRYDLIVDNGTVLLRAQCKTGRIRNGAVLFSTCSTNGFTCEKTSYEGQIDLFLVYVPDSGLIYWVPIEGCPATQMSLRIGDAERGSNASGIRWAHDYLLPLPETGDTIGRTRTSETVSIHAS